MDRSTSTAHRALAELRAVGLLEWNHRFEGPTHDNPRPHPTSNLYEFVIPNQLAKEAGLTKRLQRLRWTSSAAAPSVTQRAGAQRNGRSPADPGRAGTTGTATTSESHVHGAALVADATFEGVVAEIESDVRRRPRPHQLRLGHPWNRLAATRRPDTHGRGAASPAVCQLPQTPPT